MLRAMKILYVYYIRMRKHGDSRKQGFKSVGLIERDGKGEKEEEEIDFRVL